MTSFGKWTPTIPILPRNHIISSDYPHAKPFHPDYCNEPEDMQLIMSNSYAKKWHQEKTVFKKRLEDEKIENEVFLVRRYVIRGLNKKRQNMEALKAVPSRVQIGKKVPFAVRLRPKDDPPQSPSPKSTKGSKASSSAPSRRSLKSKKSEHKLGLHVSIEENENPSACQVDDSDGHLTIKANVVPANIDLKTLQETSNHVHIEGRGNKFVVHRIDDSPNHCHECDCAEFEPNDEPRKQGPCSD